MKVQIRDRDALESLTTANLRAYLEEHGWADAGRWGERPVVIYSKEQDGRKWEVLVPLRDTASDYAESMAWAVNTLAEAEDRSQLDVFYDLANPIVGTVPQGNRKGDNEMPNVWCVQAEFGKHVDRFVNGGYAGIGWIPDKDLTEITDKAHLYTLYRQAYPDHKKKGAEMNVGQISRFLLMIKPGDYIITRTKNKDLWRYGRVANDLYYEPNSNDGCPFPHRRKVDWGKQPLDKTKLSIPFRKAMGAGLTVYAIKHREEFLTVIGPHRKMLDELLKIDETEFDMLVSTSLKHKGWRIAK